MSKSPVRIASRGSMLALWQANHVKSLLEGKGLTCEIRVIKTTGDRVQDRFLHEIGGKGLFVKEIEEALLADEADLAVHSLKDLPARTPEPFRLASILPRNKSGDVLVVRKNHPGITSLPNQLIGRDAVAGMGKSAIATGSLRRSHLLQAANPDIRVEPIRGNVDTRLNKLIGSDWLGIILAEASLERLGLEDNLILRSMDPAWFVPCAGQGALAIEVNGKANLAAEVKAALAVLDCEKTRSCVSAEREVLAGLGGDCTMPCGCNVTVDDRGFRGRAVVLSSKGSARADVRLAPGSSTEALAQAILAELLQNGANEVLEELGLPKVQNKVQ